MISDHSTIFLQKLPFWLIIIFFACYLIDLLLHRIYQTQLQKQKKKNI